MHPDNWGSVFNLKRFHKLFIFQQKTVIITKDATTTKKPKIKRVKKWEIFEQFQKMTVLPNFK
jgi:hypothetical protein